MADMVYRERLDFAAAIATVVVAADLWLGAWGACRPPFVRTADTLYHRDGRTVVVNTPKYPARLMQEDWSTIPLAPHLQRPVSHHGVLGANNHPRSDGWRGAGASP
jgi:hypothetical protein